jgi:transposase
MRKVREVLRLRFDLGLKQDQIARSCSIAQPTVHRYLERAAAVGLTWPLPEDYDDQRLNELLFPSRPAQVPSSRRTAVDFGAVDQQLKSHKHVTLQLLWEEYRQTNPDGYGYSRYVTAALMLPWYAGPRRVSVFASTHRNINMAPAGSIGL